VRGNGPRRRARPFFSSSVLAALALTGATAAAPKKEWLPRIAAGDAVAALAILEATDRLDADGITLRVTKTRTGYRLNGAKMFVTDAHVADVLVVAGRSRSAGETGICLFAVPVTRAA